MNRRTLLGRFTALNPANRLAERPDYFRTLLEPLEQRQLLSASTLTWTIDAANSGVTLAIPDQNTPVELGGTNYPLTLRLRDQGGAGSTGTWDTGNTTNFSGTLAIDYVDGSQLQFMTGQSVFGEVDQTLWRPNIGTPSPNPDYNPNNPKVGTSSYPFLYSNFTFTPNEDSGDGTYLDNSSAPAAFGTRLNGTITYPLVIFGSTVPVPITADIGYLSLTQLENDANSPVLPISNTGTFAANTTNLGATTGTLLLQGLLIAGVTQVPSLIASGDGLSIGTNAAPTGTITTTGTLTRKLTLPLSVPFLLPGLGSNPSTGTLTGQIVATTTLTAPTVDLNGSGAGTSFSNVWSASGPVGIGGSAAASPGKAQILADTVNLATTSGVTAALAASHTGDVLAANTTGTSITASYAGGTLTLSGSDTTAHYEQVLQTVTYDNTAGGPGVPSVTVKVFATDSFALTGAEADSVITISPPLNTPPTVDLNGAAAGTGFTSSWSGFAPVVITDAANATITDDGTTLGSMKVTLASIHTGDVLAAVTTGTAITQSYSGGTLSLTGTDTVADYQTVLRSITYNNTISGPGVAVETATIVTTDTGPGSPLTSAPVTATINMPAPTVVLTTGSGTGTPNITTAWYNSGAVPIENNALASVGALSGANIQSLTVTLATFHTGDVLAVPILPGITAISTSYSAGTLTLSGSDTTAHYQQELRFINYNNTVGGPGATPILATYVASDGTHASTPVTSTININVASGQVLGNRLFYNNSKFDGGAGSGNAAINSNDDLAIASDKTGYNGAGTATFASISAFTKGITGVMVDLQAGIGAHSAINLTSGDVTFKVAPNTFVTTTYNQLSTWSAAPTPTNISVRLGVGTGGSDRLEITWATGAIKNTWLEVDVKADANTGLSVPDVFYFGSAVGNSGAGDTSTLSKVDVNDYNAANNNVIGLTTTVWNLTDYTKDGKVDISDSNAAINGVFTLHYIANPTGPFAPDSGGGSATPSAAPAATPASASGAVSSGLTILNSSSINLPSWLSGRLQSILTSPPVTKAIESALHNPQILQTVEQIASKLHLNDDVLDGLLNDLGL